MSLFANSKKVRIAINGFGRIGRAAFKIIAEREDAEVVAINDLSDAHALAYLLQYDSVYGRYVHTVTANKNALKIDGRSVPLSAEKDPAQLPWKEYKVDVVLECTGVFRTTEAAGKHIEAGARKVIISAPAKDGETPTCLIGVNDGKIKKTADVISNASCTTNGLGAVTDVIRKKFGIKKAIMSTIHAYTASQTLVDGPDKDLRRGRAGAINIIPTSTGAAIAMTKTIPQLVGKFDGMAYRVPVATGSVIDAVYLLDKKTTEAKVNAEITKASKQAAYKGVIAASVDPIVSSDIIGHPASAIVDLPFTKIVDGDLLKLVIWYDNEWGYSNRLAELAIKVGKK